VTAASCAAEAGLSPSRFLHLFKEETGISFRSFRAWKRARHLLHFANQDINLAHLAQDIGYPDSTHFSHSIRRFYGLKPRAIFSGSRDLAIYSHRRAAPTIAGGRKKPADARTHDRESCFRDPRVSHSKADPWATRPSLPAR
jgi:AraC-like DNA-binding protein